MDASPEQSAAAPANMRVVNVMSAQLMEEIRSDWTKTLVEKRNMLQLCGFGYVISLMKLWCKEFVTGAYLSLGTRACSNDTDLFVFGSGRHEVLSNFRQCLPPDLPTRTRGERFDSLLEWVAKETADIVNKLLSFSDFYCHGAVPRGVLRNAARLWNVTMFGDYGPQPRSAGDGHQVIGIPALRAVGDAERSDDHRLLGAHSLG